MKNKLLKARIIAEHKGSYVAKSEDVNYLCRVTGKHIYSASSREDYPAVGDWVTISKIDKEKAIIDEILPRKTIIKRKSSGKNQTQIIATNIDVAFIVESVDRDYNLNRFERYLSIIGDENIEPKIILNKIDLIPQKELDFKLSQTKERIGNIDIYLTSTVTNEGLNQLKTNILKGKTYCFLGSSGVGKSSLINKLIGQNIIKTKGIGFQTGRGKHTTTNREMYFIENGGIVIDNPGMREVGMLNTDIGIDNSFDEIVELSKKCKYNNCTHSHEPDCEVLSALNSGDLDEDKYSNYTNLKKEVEHYNMTELEKREKNRDFGKFIKNTKKDLKNLKHKDY